MNDENDRTSESRSRHGAADPLPRDWLPEAHPPEGHPAWELRTARIMAAADREWARIELRGIGGEPSWLSEVGSWWRPAAALAAAAVALLLWTDPPVRTEPAHTAAEMALGLVASDGDPVALWAALGVSADPVLALLTFEDHRAWGAETSPAASSTGERP